MRGVREDVLGPVAFVDGGLVVLYCLAKSLPPFTVKKLECSKRAIATEYISME